MNYNLVKNSDNSLSFTVTILETGLIDSVWSFDIAGTAIDWSSLIGMPWFIGGSTAADKAGAGSVAYYSAPTNGAEISKITVEIPPYEIPPVFTPMPILNLITDSTYSFTIEPGITSTYPFFITTSSTGGQAAEDNSIHSGSEITESDITVHRT